jgi:hypothetical protein
VRVRSAVEREADQWQAVPLADRQGAVADGVGDVRNSRGACLRPGRVEHDELKPRVQHDVLQHVQFLSFNLDSGHIRA